VERLSPELPVLLSVPIPGSSDVVVLLDPEVRPAGVEKWHPYHNLLRVAPDGTIRWTAELVPNEHAAKCWTGVSYDGSLVAFTYSWECDLDAATGRILEARFTK
jgi:hypothetical protein